MASFVKFQNFVDDLCNGVHDLDGTDTLKIALSNTAPSAATNTILAHITQISYTNLNATTIDIENTGSETGGTFTVAGSDKVWTATNGDSETFRYVVVYNDTPTSPADPLIGYWDYGTGVTLATNETFTWDTSTSVFTVA